MSGKTGKYPSCHATRQRATRQRAPRHAIGRARVALSATRSYQRLTPRYPEVAVESSKQMGNNTLSFQMSQPPQIIRVAVGEERNGLSDQKQLS